MSNQVVQTLQQQEQILPSSNQNPNDCHGNDIMAMISDSPLQCDTYHASPLKAGVGAARRTPQQITAVVDLEDMHPFMLDQ